MTRVDPQRRAARATIAAALEELRARGAARCRRGVARRRASRCTPLPPCRRRDRPRAARRASRRARRAARRARRHLRGRARWTTRCSSRFQTVAHARGIPRAYPDELLAGHGDGRRERRVRNAGTTLLRYCYRVAGTVGLMMCHVMGVRGPRRWPTRRTSASRCSSPTSPRRARGLGARTPVPAGRAAGCGCGCPRAAPRARVSRFPRPPPGRRASHRYAARSRRRLLPLRRRRPALPLAALRVRGPHGAPASTRAIGDRVRAQGCDPRAGRAVVSRRGKLAALARAALVAARALPAALRRPARRSGPNACLDDPDRVLLPPGT